MTGLQAFTHPNPRALTHTYQYSPKAPRDSRNTQFNWEGSVPKLSTPIQSNFPTLRLAFSDSASRSRALATSPRGYPPTSSQIPEAQAPRRPAALSHWPPSPGVVLLTEMPPSNFPLSFGPVLTREQRGFGDVAGRAKLGRAARGGGGTTVAVGAFDVAEELLGLAQVLPQPSQVAAIAAEAPAQLSDHSAASRAGARHGLAGPRLPVGLHRSARCLRGWLRRWPGPLLPPSSAQRRRNPPPDAPAGAPLRPPAFVTAAAEQPESSAPARTFLCPSTERSEGRAHRGTVAARAPGTCSLCWVECHNAHGEAPERVDPTDPRAYALFV